MPRLEHSQHRPCASGFVFTARVCTEGSCTDHSAKSSSSRSDLIHLLLHWIHSFSRACMFHGFFSAWVTHAESRARNRDTEQLTWNCFLFSDHKNTGYLFLELWSLWCCLVKQGKQVTTVYNNKDIALNYTFSWIILRTHVSLWTIQKKIWFSHLHECFSFTRVYVSMNGIKLCHSLLKATLWRKILLK